jgi:hypothetical protein
MTLAVNIAQSGSNNVTFRNRIINGAMVIDQRNAGASITPTSDGTYCLDRFRCGLSASSKYSVQQSTTTATGFKNSLLATSLSAYVVGVSETFNITQMVEGLNIFDFGWGTANAKPVTLSFWVQSSLTGTFGGAIKNSAEDRVYPFSYTISSANTFEYKTITIAGDTSGTWLTTNGIGLKVVFSLGTGSNLSGTAGAWGAGNIFSATGAVSVVGTNTATFYITGVQLEAGTTATPFEYRQYGTELNLCQRYYQRQTGGGRHFIGGNGGVSNCFPTAYLLQTLRSTPTLSYSAVGDFTIEGLTGGGQSTCTALSLNAYTFNSVTVNVSSSSGTGGTGGQLLGNSSSVWTAFSAEL